METFRQFLNLQRESDDVIAVRRIYIDLAGDLAAGVMLSQILYWHTPDKHGKTRLQVELDGHRWIARGREDWWDDCRIKSKQADRCLSELKERGLIITKVAKFMGAPTTHVRIDEDGFMQALNNRRDEIDKLTDSQSSEGKNDIPQKGISNLPDEESRSSSNGNMEIPHQGSSISTETSSKTTQIEPASKSKINGNASQLERAAELALLKLDPGEQKFARDQAKRERRPLHELMWQMYNAYMTEALRSLK